MKSNINISYTNTKGQIVIPKEYRDSLSINASVPLLFSMFGNTITITPVKGVITKIDDENSFIDILSKTKGKWGKVADVKKRKTIELSASKRRKSEW